MPDAFGEGAVMPLAFFTGPTEWIIIGLVVLLLFGKRLPQMARSMGSSVIEFKKGLRQGAEDEGPTESIEGGVSAGGAESARVRDAAPSGERGAR